MGYENIELYVTSNAMMTRELEEVIAKYGKDRPRMNVQIKPVLDYPKEVIVRQLFHAPALLIDGKVVQVGVEDAEELDELLAALL